MMFFVILQYISSVTWWHQNASLMSEKSVILKEVKCAVKANVPVFLSSLSSFVCFTANRTGFSLFFMDLGSTRAHLEVSLRHQVGTEQRSGQQPRADDDVLRLIEQSQRGRALPLAALHKTHTLSLQSHLEGPRLLSRSGSPRVTSGHLRSPPLT